MSLTEALSLLSLQCLRLVCTSLTADQMAQALQCLAQQDRFVPASWWLVRILAVTHSRVTDYSAPAAAVVLWAAAKLSKNSALPSEKWTEDFSTQFWDHVKDITEVDQLGKGLWGSITVGYNPRDDQWKAWEAAGARFQWQLSLAAAREAVQGYRKIRRPVPAELLGRLQEQYEIEKARQAAEIAAAEKARQEAAAQLLLQQQRVAAVTAAIAQQQLAQGVLPGGQQTAVGSSKQGAGKGKQPKRVFGIGKKGKGGSSKQQHQQQQADKQGQGGGRSSSQHHAALAAMTA